MSDPTRPAPERGLPPFSQVEVYTPEETEWLAAVEQHRKLTGKKFLAATDYLRLARRLGYKKGAA